MSDEPDFSPERRQYMIPDEDCLPKFMPDPDKLLAELASKDATISQMTALLREYRDSNEDHKEGCWTSFQGVDIRCDTCIKADALLPKESK